MDFISTAFAQAAADAAAVQPSFFTDNAVSILSIVGVCVVLISFALVITKTPVTTGHSVILGVGLAFLALPFVTAFEWSDTGFKITMKSTAEALVAEVAHLTKENGEIREELLKVNEGLKTIASRVDQQSSSAPTSDTAPSPETPIAGWRSVLPPKDIEEFSVRNKSAIELNKGNLNRLQDLQKSLQAPLWK